MIAQDPIPSPTSDQPILPWPRTEGAVTQAQTGEASLHRGRVRVGLGRQSQADSSARGTVSL